MKARSDTHATSPTTVRIPLPLADATAVVAFAQRAEALGFDGLTVGDHWSHARWYGNGRDPRIDPLVSLGAAAAVTSSLELQTSVLCAAHHHPAVIARAFATLQAMTAGRAVLGLGAGWDEKELTGYGMPTQRRVSRMIEFLQAVRALWAGQPHHGDFYQIPDPLDGALQVNEPIPVLLAGGGPRTVRAAAEHADRVSLMAPWLAKGYLDFEAAADFDATALERQLEPLRATGCEVEGYLVVSIASDTDAAWSRLATGTGVDEARLRRSMMFVVGDVAEVSDRLQADFMDRGIHRFELRQLEGELDELAEVAHRLREG